MQLSRTGYRLSDKTLDGVICALIIAFSLLIWWPSRYFPYFWDSAGYVINTALDILTKTPFSLASMHTNFAHPPFMTGLLALSWRLFGNTQLVSHVVMFPFLPLFLISTYFLGKKYLTRFFAVLATSLIAFSPVVLAEYLNIYIDLPAAALTTAAVCLFVWKRPVKGISIFTLAVLTKLPVITVIPFIFFHLKPKQRWLLAIPGMVMLIWLIYHQRMTGWLLVEPIRETIIPKTIGETLSSIRDVFEIFFIDQTKWVWTGIAGISLVFLGIKQRLSLSKIRPYLDLLSTITISLTTFIIFNEFGPRYYLYFLPLYAVLVSIILQKSFRALSISSNIVVLAVLILPLTQMLSWRGTIATSTRYDFNPPSDLAIIDMIRIFRELSATIEVMGPEAKVYGGFPENQMLIEPYQGYVTKPIDFNYCSNYSYDPSVLQLVIIHPYAPTQFSCRELLDTQKLIPIQHFEKNGKWVELYQVSATASASPSANLQN